MCCRYGFVECRIATGVSELKISPPLLPVSLTEYLQILRKMYFLCSVDKWRRSVVVITIAQLHSARVRFCAGSNPAHGVSEICNGEDF